MSKYEINNPRFTEMRNADELDLRDEIGLTRTLIEEAINSGDRVGALASLHALTSLCRAHVTTSEFSERYLHREAVEEFARRIVIAVSHELGFLPDAERGRVVDAIVARISQTQLRIEDQS